jgi:hypothetical protein
MGSLARADILATLKLFNGRFPHEIRESSLEKSSTPARANIAPLYNYDMSMEGTLERTINFRIDYSKEYAKLEKLRRQVARDPHNKTAVRYYTELSQQIGAGQPFIRLRKQFDEDMDLLSRLSQRKGAEADAQAARAKVEEDLKAFATICENATAATKQIAQENYEKGAIFVEGHT